jgi:hypothetical protein
MWQLHAAFRFGDYRTPEIDITPAVCLSVIAMFFALMIKTGL